jgi:hypothetical protein
VKPIYLGAVAALITGVAGCGILAAGPPAAQNVFTAKPVPVTASAGVAGTASARPPGLTRASPAPTLTGTATLTVADTGVTVRLRAGQQVDVTLASEGFFSWHVPTATGAAVRRVSASGGYPGRQPARAAFLAVRPGGAVLDTINDTACLHAQPACLPAQQEWRVTVIVTGG